MRYRAYCAAMLALVGVLLTGMLTACRAADTGERVQFDQKTWAQGHTLEMATDIQVRGLLTSKTPAQVYALLGKPNGGPSNGLMVYYLPDAETGELQIAIRDGRVLDVAVIDQAWPHK